MEDESKHPGYTGLNVIAGWLVGQVSSSEVAVGRVGHVRKFSTDSYFGIRVDVTVLSERGVRKELGFAITTGSQMEIGATLRLQAKIKSTDTNESNR